MTKKQMFYEAPQCEVCEDLLCTSFCLNVSAEESMVYDNEPYFE